MSKHLKEIEKVLYEEYGCGLCAASGPVGLWAAEKCSNPREALKALNRVLQRYGKPLCHAPYGSPAF